MHSLSFLNKECDKYMVKIEHTFGEQIHYWFNYSLSVT